MGDDTDQPQGEALTYGLCFAFPDPSPSFVHGYEAGAIGHRMQSGEAEIDTINGHPLHTENVELFKRMAGYYGYEMETKSVTSEGFPDSHFSEWTGIKFTKIEGGRKPKPSLRVVGGDAA